MLPCHLFMICFSFLGEIIGFSPFEGTIQRWELTSHEVAKIKSYMKESVIEKRCCKTKRVTARKNRF